MKTRETVKTMYLRGVKPWVIQQETGVPPGTQHNWGMRYGWAELLAKTRQVIAHRGIKALQQDHTLRLKLRNEVKSQVAALERTPVKNIKELGNTPEREGRTSLLCRMVSAVKEIDDWGAAAKPGLILGELLSNEAVDVESTVNTGDCAQVGEGDGSVQGEPA